MIRLLNLIGQGCRDLRYSIKTVNHRTLRRMVFALSAPTVLLGCGVDDSTSKADVPQFDQARQVVTEVADRIAKPDRDQGMQDEPTGRTLESFQP